MRHVFRITGLYAKAATIDDDARVVTLFDAESVLASKK